jgi:hypothetical protein
MTLDIQDPELAPLLASLKPYACSLLERAGMHALRLHADSVSPEHLLSILMEDEDSAAHAAVLHAFADPETISGEALAISPGLMVVASGSTLPFSPRAAGVLARARVLGAAGSAVEVGTANLLAQAAAALDEDSQAALRAAGLPIGAASPASAEPPALGAALFKHFSAPAKRALSAANRLAAGQRLRAIAPAHLLLGCLMEDAHLAQVLGLSFQRARILLGARTADDSLPAPRRLPPDPTLIGLLRGLPAGSDSLALLARFLSGETPELAQILIRSKVTAAFLARARGAFLDPEAAQEPGPPRR